MRRLWIADVHANLPAFEAVLRDAGEVDDIVFLGDIVGFGPHPAECVDLLWELDALAIAGNHDVEVLCAPPPSESQSGPVNWLHWTRAQLEDDHLLYIEALPADTTVQSGFGEVSAIHHPVAAPYLHPAMPDAVLADWCRATPGAVVAFAHSHRAMDRAVDGRRLICLPAVGQPRDGDPRAGYALEVDGALSFHRAAYDVEQVVADVRAIGLDASFTERWIAFLRTGYDPEWSRPYRQ